VDLDSGDGILPNGECHANDVAYWRDTFNWTSNGVYPSGSIDSDLVAAQPRHVVERMPDVTIPGTPVVKKHYYRITARGVGKDSNAIVILQTMYEFTE
jgi:type IV pilus assembly protein PilX